MDRFDGPFFIRFHACGGQCSPVWGSGVGDSLVEFLRLTFNQGALPCQQTLLNPQQLAA
jgi:hypothetical protein